MKSCIEPVRIAAIEPLRIAPNGSIVDSRTAEEIAFCEGWKPTARPNTKDVQESWRVAKAIKAAPKQCWLNARKAVLKLADYAQASLVEGWALLGGVVPIEHGWIVRDNTIIDPTLPDRHLIYIPGLEFQGRTDIEHFLSTPRGRKCKKTACFYAFGWGGMDCPRFRACYDEAMGIMNRQQEERQGRRK